MVDLNNMAKKSLNKSVIGSGDGKLMLNFKIKLMELDAVQLFQELVY